MHTLCTHSAHHAYTCTYDWLLFRMVSSAHDSSAVLLVSFITTILGKSWCQSWVKEGGVSYYPHHTSFCCLEIQLPDGVLSGTGRKELDIRASELLYPGTRPGSNMAWHWNLVSNEDGSCLHVPFLLVLTHLHSLSPRFSPHTLHVHTHQHSSGWTAPHLQSL